MNKILRKFLVRLILSPLIALMSGFWFMIAVGIAHSEWLPQLPTIGYWWAVLIVFLLCGVFSPQRDGDE